MALEIRQMRYLLVLAELGSFARAAVVLHLSQSALSRRMSRARPLERVLVATSLRYK
jgi:DNA-binding transcriptional LysR family regulator